MLKIKSQKAYLNLPSGHCQYFDLEPDGSPGDCASIHGYDRSVRFEFSGDIDDHGWIVPFGELKPVKDFLEFYFDHVTLIGADDPRLPLPKELTDKGGFLATLRIMPYGVSMEMSAMFIWEHVNPYVWHTTNGRCYVSKVESIEHERNSAYIEIDEQTARRQAQKYNSELLPKRAIWEFESPKAAMDRLNS